jgi:hypothetical protein
VRWAGHIARMGEKRNAYKILVVITRRKEKYLDVGGSIILKWFLER